MGKALKSETRNGYDMNGDSVMNVEVFDAGSNSNNIPLVKLSAMGGQFVSFKFVSFKELSSQGTPYTVCSGLQRPEYECTRPRDSCWQSSRAARCNSSSYSSW
jgi:hypothetical protein